MSIYSQILTNEERLPFRALPQDILEYGIPDYMGTLELYRGRTVNPAWENLYRARLQSWSTTPEPWILAATEGDVELMETLLTISPSIPDITYMDRSNGVNAVVNIALDNYHPEIADLVMTTQLLNSSVHNYEEALVRLAAGSDKWAEEGFSLYEFLFPLEEDQYGGDSLLGYSSNHREFLQMMERILRLGLINDRQMLGSLDDLRFIDSWLVQMDLVTLYSRFFPNFDFDPVWDRLTEINDERANVVWSMVEPNRKS